MYYKKYVKEKNHVSFVILKRTKNSRRIHCHISETLFCGPYIFSK
jgi:hypothetical protein